MSQLRIILKNILRRRRIVHKNTWNLHLARVKQTISGCAENNIDLDKEMGKIFLEHIFTDDTYGRIIFGFCRMSILMKKTVLIADWQSTTFNIYGWILPELMVTGLSYNKIPISAEEMFFRAFQRLKNENVTRIYLLLQQKIIKDLAEHILLFLPSNSAMDDMKLFSFWNFVGANHDLQCHKPHLFACPDLKAKSYLDYRWESIL